MFQESAASALYCQLIYSPAYNRFAKLRRDKNWSQRCRSILLRGTSFKLDPMFGLERGTRCRKFNLRLWQQQPKILFGLSEKKYQGLSFDLISINVDYIFVGALLHIWFSSIIACLVFCAVSYFNETLDKCWLVNLGPVLSFLRVLPLLSLRGGKLTPTWNAKTSHFVTKKPDKNIFLSVGH